MRRIAFTLCLAVLPLGAQNNAAGAWQKFFSAGSPGSAAKAVEGIIKSGVSFDDAWSRLKQGRAYTAQPSGVVQMKNIFNTVEHPFAVTVPEGYDQTKSYQVRFQLHGGIGGRQGNQPRGNGTVGALTGAEQFYVAPTAWLESPWWSSDQSINLAGILDKLKRRYNIDENRVVVSGVSDGATGAYYLAMRDTTPYASFLPLNGYIMVLSNRDIDDGRIFPNNLRNKPFFVVNGGRDRLYPTSVTDPSVAYLMDGGVDIDYNPQPNGEHNTSWWPEVKGPFERFVAAHPRNPYPNKLTWETSDLDHVRAHWLVIDKLGPAPGENKQLPDLNIIKPSAIYAASAAGPIFRRASPGGRVDVARKGNTVDVQTRGVSAFTLLLSPDQFDFAQPVTVVANGREVFSGPVQRDLATLLKWAARDNDRTMLYGAEINIKLK